MAASNSPAEQLITENIDIWTSAIKKRGSQGRGSSKKIELYGIKKLRELILELAVRGLLVPQDPNDEPASVLLEKIAAEKEQLIKDGKIKKQKALPEISEDEKPFELPKGWAWARLGTLFNSIMSGGTPSKRESSYWGGQIPWASVKDLGSSRYISNTQDYITEEGLLAGSKLSDAGDILICTRMGLGKIAITTAPIAINQDLKAVKLSNKVSVEYFLNTYSTLKIKGTGTTVAGIKQEELLNYVIGLPSELEQPRIVAKVDELMALCDQLEQQTETSLLAHQTLVETLLNTLLNADQNSFDPAWERIAQHFDILFTTEHSIDQLKQTILQLAVMGKLVPQDPNDEPASVLLEKIATEKEQLIKDKVIKKQKPLPPISEDEKPFGLPKGWEWSRLSDVLDVRDGTHDSPKDASGGNTYPLVTSKNFCNGEINFSEARQISEKDHLEISKRSLVEVGDILFSMIGGNLGNQVIVKDPRAFSIKNVALLKYYLKSATQPEYIKVFTEELAIELQNKASGGAQPFVSLGALRKLVFALPPFDEQHRIVAKVDGLMSLCDNLKLKISESQTTQLHLADAMAEQALN